MRSLNLGIWLLAVGLLSAFVLVSNAQPSPKAADAGDAKSIAELAAKYKAASSDRERLNLIVWGIDDKVIKPGTSLLEIRKVLGEEYLSYPLDDKVSTRAMFSLEDPEWLAKWRAESRDHKETEQHASPSGWYLVVEHNGMGVERYDLSNCHGK